MKTARHSACTLRFTDDTQYRALQKQVPDYLAKIGRLHDGLGNGDLVKYNKKGGYKLMDTVAQFHPDYKLLDNVILDEGSLEATCTLDFSFVQPGGTYAAHPGEVDAITQLGGFMVNAQDCINLEEEVYISHGWDSLQVYKGLRPDEPYQAYVKMHRRDAEFYYGDTILLQGNTVIAFFRGVTVSNTTYLFDIHSQYAGSSSVSKNPYSGDERLRSQGRRSYSKGSDFSCTSSEEQSITSRLSYSIADTRIKNTNFSGSQAESRSTAGKIQT